MVMANFDVLLANPCCSSHNGFGHDRPGSRASPSSIGCAMVSCSFSLSSSPSQRLITTQATPLPMRLVSARHSDMNLSMPTRMAIDWIGISGTIERVAASVMKPRAGDARGPRRGDHGDGEDAELLPDRQVGVGRLREEQR